MRHSVMRGLVPRIHVLLCNQDVDGRDICAKTRFALLPGHDVPNQSFRAERALVASELTAQQSIDILPAKTTHEARGLREKKMKNMLAVLAGTLMCAVWLTPVARAQTPCVT